MICDGGAARQMDTCYYSIGQLFYYCDACFLISLSLTWSRVCYFREFDRKYMALCFVLCLKLLEGQAANSVLCMFVFWSVFIMCNGVYYVFVLSGDVCFFMATKTGRGIEIKKDVKLKHRQHFNLWVFVFGRV